MADTDGSKDGSTATGVAAPSGSDAKTEKAPEPKAADRPAKADKADKPAKADKADKVEKPADKKPVVDRTKPPPAPPWYRMLRTDPPPHLRIALVIASYTYLASAFIGLALTRFRHRGHTPASST